MEAPYIVVVQGPRSSGKSTLIKSLVKLYTRQKVTQVLGPLTLRANKSLRICFYECPNTISGMIDMAKIADLALLLIDATVGFELETFEFISVLQNHGMPSVMGILTHLDNFIDNKALRRIKKVMKKKFWAETYQGAKLFYLSGLKNEAYTDRQVHNLGRFISVLKWRKTDWKNAHSFVMADRYEYVHNTGEAVFYGYVRGTNFHTQDLFVPGYGDFTVASLQEVDDPVPTMEDTPKKRTLKQQERVLYAPSCSIGTLKYDQNTGYLNLPDKYVLFTKQEGEDVEAFTPGQQMVRRLQEAATTFDEQLVGQELSVVEGHTVRQQFVSQEEEPEDLTEVVRAIKEKVKKVPLSEFVVDGAVATELGALVYGTKNQPRRKVASRNALDSFKMKITPRFRTTEEYLDLLKPCMMAGTDFREEAEKEEEEQDEEKEQVVEKMGVKTGTYVRIKVAVGSELYGTMSPDKPIVLCAVGPMEGRLGFIKARFKTHRFLKHILKNKDPLILSAGWHRFQTIPYYTIEDRNAERLRMIKYTPKHTFCFMVFYGPLLAINTALIAIQDMKSAGFRISGSGVILELNYSFPIMKKLKLVGDPLKVFKNTAFIKNMFNSPLQVAKFAGAKIKTVSGIRGMIKKPARDGIGPPGTFRATFEDKIQPSDIVFMRTYFKVELKKYYNPLVDFSSQRLLKTHKAIRNERGLELEDSKDSHYGPLVRPEPSHQGFRTPHKLEEALPFKSKPKPTFTKAEDVKGMLSEREKKIEFFLKRLGTVKNIRVGSIQLKQTKEKQRAKSVELEKKKAREEAKKELTIRKRIKVRSAKKKLKPNS